MSILRNMCMQGLICTSFLILVHTPCTAATIEEVAANAMPSVVRIVTYDITGAVKTQASGFFISPGKIITNEHVLRGAYSAEVFTNEEYYDLITILRTDKNMDLALLAVDALNERPLELNRDARLRPGQRVIAIGNPLGLDQTLSDGLISALRMVDDIQILQITAPISPGSSGGPLLDEQGQVIGVVSSTIREGQNLNFAIGPKTIEDFLRFEEHPEQLKVAGERVLWRAIIKWIMATIFVLIAVLLGGELLWVIIIPIFIIALLWHLGSWLCRYLYKLAVMPFRYVHRCWSKHSSSAPSASSGKLNALGEDTKSDMLSIHCWKCGASNEFDSVDNTIICSECGVALTIPRELGAEE